VQWLSKEIFMALKKTVGTPFGVDIVDAYHRVEGLSLDNKAQITFWVRAYKDAASTVAAGSVNYTCAYDMSATNPLAQAYEFVKLQPEFAGATDC
jgi:hypothetical protein